jgi:hypothetical protein
MEIRIDVHRQKHRNKSNKATRSNHRLSHHARVPNRLAAHRTTVAVAAMQQRSSLDEAKQLIESRLCVPPLALQLDEPLASRRYHVITGVPASGGGGGGALVKWWRHIVAISYRSFCAASNATYIWHNRSIHTIVLLTHRSKNLFDCLFFQRFSSRYDNAKNEHLP